MLLDEALNDRLVESSCRDVCGRLVQDSTQVDDRVRVGSAGSLTIPALPQPLDQANGLPAQRCALPAGVEQSVPERFVHLCVCRESPVKGDKMP